MPCGPCFIFFLNTIRYSLGGGGVIEQSSPHKRVFVPPHFVFFIHQVYNSSSSPNYRLLSTMYPRPHADDWVKEKNLPIVHKAIKVLNLLPLASEDVHQTKLTDPVPWFSELNQALFVLPLAILPYDIRSLYYNYVSHELPGPYAMWGYLFLYTMAFGVYWIHFLKHLSKKYGYFNSGRGRDTIPFSEVDKVAKEILGALFLRSAMVVFSSYDPHTAPSLSIWTPIQLFFFTVVDDFYYYWLHRACHEMDSAWKLHRLHHTTKAPTLLLLGYADDIQECFDLLLVPLATWLTYPIPFDAFIIWMLIHVSIQVVGHSGIRLHHGTILTGPYLTPFGAEIVMEDHDLHHRHGWRESYNYGKQSSLWDALFGTKGDRIEGHSGNIDRTTFIY